MKPPVRWFGSKVMLAPALIAMLPEHDHYVEVFAGSAAVLFAKPRSTKETLNDLDGDVVNLFAVLRDPATAGALNDLVTLTPYARQEYLETLLAGPVDDPVERARRFLLLSWQTMGGSPSAGRWSKATGSIGTPRAHLWARMPDRLAGCADRLRGVQIESVDWSEILTKYDNPGVAMLVDPPYLAASRVSSMGEYRHEMTDADHERLVAALKGLQHAAAIVTHYPHPLYDSLGWQHTDISAYADSASTGSTVARVERVWTSHPVAERLAGIA